MMTGSDARGSQNSAMPASLLHSQSGPRMTKLLLHYHCQDMTSSHTVDSGSTRGNIMLQRRATYNFDAHLYTCTTLGVC